MCLVVEERGPQERGTYGKVGIAGEEERRRENRRLSLLGRMRLKKAEATVGAGAGAGAGAVEHVALWQPE